MHVIVNGLDVAYEQEGKGPVLLMVHGWGSNLKTYDGLSASLAKKYCCLRVDLPGFGGSQAPKQAWQLDDYAHFLDALLAKLNIPKLHALIGHSLGGRIAIRAQSTGHMPSEKLVLLASHGISNPHNPRLLAYKLVAKVGKVVLAIFPSRVQQKLRAKLYDSAGSTDYLNVTPAMAQTFRNIINQDLRADATKVPTDTLLVYGESDTMTPPKFGKILAERIPKSRLELIPSAGHYVHNDAPQPVAKLIGEFL